MPSTPRFIRSNIREASFTVKVPLSHLRCVLVVQSWHRHTSDEEISFRHRDWSFDLKSLVAWDWLRNNRKHLSFARHKQSRQLNIGSCLRTSVREGEERLNCRAFDHIWRLWLPEPLWRRRPKYHLPWHLPGEFDIKPERFGVWTCSSIDDKHKEIFQWQKLFVLRENLVWKLGIKRGTALNLFGQCHRANGLLDNLYSILVYTQVWIGIDIVMNDQIIIGGESNIEFQRCHALFKSVYEGWFCIFRAVTSNSSMPLSPSRSPYVVVFVGFYSPLQ